MTGDFQYDCIPAQRPDNQENIATISIITINSTAYFDRQSQQHRATLGYNERRWRNNWRPLRSHCAASDSLPWWKRT
jgi:hypothetical protein